MHCWVETAMSSPHRGGVPTHTSEPPPCWAVPALSVSCFYHISSYHVELPQMAHKHHISFTPVEILAGSPTKGNIRPVISAAPYGIVVPPHSCCSCIALWLWCAHVTKDGTVEYFYMAWQSVVGKCQRQCWMSSSQFWKTAHLHDTGLSSESHTC